MAASRFPAIITRLRSTYHWRSKVAPALGRTRRGAIWWSAMVMCEITACKYETRDSLRSHLLALGHPVGLGDVQLMFVRLRRAPRLTKQRCGLLVIRLPAGREVK